MSRAEGKRLSGSFMSPISRGHSPLIPTSVLPQETSGCVKAWQSVYARDIVDSRIVSISAETSVEEACELLLSEDIICLAVKSPTESGSPGSNHLLGLFDFADVNAFLTLAATRHIFTPEYLGEHPRVAYIVNAARAGRVPVHLVSNLSEKNPLCVLPNDATIISLLQIFSRGKHRALIQAPSPSQEYVGMVSDRGLLSWFSSQSDDNITLLQFTSNSLQHLALPSFNIRNAVVSTTSSDCVLDAMKLMSEQGVSSVAVVDDDTGQLLSAVSVTDIGKIVVPSQSKQILSTPLKQFVSQIKAPEGSTDGADKFPVYSVNPTSSLAYTIQKILATNAHRVFVTRENGGSISPSILPTSPGNLSGIVSVVDILSFFARMANIPGVDPTQMQRHRRASSSSSCSSMSDRDPSGRSRSSSRTSVRRMISASVAAAGMTTETASVAVAGVESQLQQQRHLSGTRRKD